MAFGSSRLEAEKIFHNLYRTDFCFVKLCFQSEFFFSFDFQMHENHLKSFTFKILFILLVIVRPFISLVTKFEAYNFFWLPN